MRAVESNSVKSARNDKLHKACERVSDGVMTTVQCNIEQVEKHATSTQQQTS